MKRILKYPVLFTSICAGVMYFIDFLSTGYKINIPVSLPVIVFISGLVIIVVGGYAFSQVNTTVDPAAPEKTTYLVTTGIYQFSRNPMYVGFFLWLVSAMLYIGNIVNLLIFPLYIIMINKMYIFPEEEMLGNLFQNDFKKYKQRTRRWI